MRVLLIDDDPDDLEMMSLCVRELLSHAEVITLLGSPFVNGIDPNHYDLIVIDERIGSVSGTETSRIFRRQGYKGKIILITGYERSPEAFDHWIPKDCKFSSFRNLLRMIADNEKEET